MLPWLMRRALAMLLVVVFSYPLIAPAVAARLDLSALPACCRPNGKHHCMMSMMMTVNVPSRYQAVSETCPYRPFANVTLMLPHAIAARTTPAAAAQAAGPAAAVRDVEAGYRISFHRARQKRGPPSLLAL